MSESQSVMYPKGSILRKQGFEAGSVVLDSRVDFTIGDMAASMFESRQSAPKTVPVRLYGIGTVQVAITILRAVFSDDSYTDDITPSERDVIEFPNWYFEGWIVDGTSSYVDQRMRVRGYAWPVGSLDPQAIDLTQAQIIPMNPDPEGQIGLCELR